LWESLSPEDQERYHLDLQKDANWVIWCKAKPKDIVTQAFRTYGNCIFDGKRTNLKQTDDIHEESMGGKHVTRARSWWKRGDVSACAAQTNMQCWVHRDALINDAQVETSLREAWEHEGSKDEKNIVLQGPEQYFWKGTERKRAGWVTMTFLGRPGQGMGWYTRVTRVSWGQGVSTFNDLVVPLKSEWEEKRKESAH